MVGSWGFNKNKSITEEEGKNLINLLKIGIGIQINSIRLYRVVIGIRLSFKVENNEMQCSKTFIKIVKLKSI